MKDSARATENAPRRSHEERRRAPIEDARRAPRLWIDGDGCPVVVEARRVAARHGVPVSLVTGPSQRRLPASEGFEQVTVGGASEAVDDWIASRIVPGDTVVTDDLPLADRCLKAGAKVLSSRGIVCTEENMGTRLAQRELAKFLRELGEVSGGPSAFRGESRSRFKMVLHELLQQRKREAAPS